jgi:hypothetical protein
MSAASVVLTSLGGGHRDAVVEMMGRVLEGEGRQAWQPSVRVMKMTRRISLCCELDGGKISSEQSRLLQHFAV